VRSRPPPAGSARSTGAPGEASKSGITLSGLLNAIDGIGARDGRILFITSNHPDALDPALIRPGRIDMRVHLAHSGMPEATAMFNKFFPTGDLAAFQAEIASALPLPAAELQNRLLSHERA
jgi:chaperone BCS1